MRPSAEALQAIRERVAECRANGLEHIQLFVRREAGTVPSNWARSLVSRGRPSLYGRCIGDGDADGQWLFDVHVDDVERWLDGTDSRDRGTGHIKTYRLKRGGERFRAWMAGDYLGTFESHVAADAAVERRKERILRLAK
jgi:hypothetical protein